MQRSSVAVPTRRTRRGVAVVDYPRTAGLSPISLLRGPSAWAEPAEPGPHAHDFLMLVYVEDGPAAVRVDDRDWSLDTGDAFVVAPGAVVVPAPGPGPGLTWVLFFPADAVDPAAAAPLVSWRTHPLLAPFVGSHGGGAQRLQVPPADRADWLTHLADLDTELRGRRDGYADAARARLTLLLVRLGRLQLDVPAELGVEPLVAAVFDLVEARYHEPISLRDVAAAVGLTTGHLTTVIGRRTGRSVQQWITERRMREARRLLADTDLPVAEIAGRVGYREASYFARRFRAAHGVTPGTWRHHRAVPPARS